MNYAPMGLLKFMLVVSQGLLILVLIVLVLYALSMRD
jgi:hypothetical protein